VKQTPTLPDRLDRNIWDTSELLIVLNNLDPTWKYGGSTRIAVILAAEYFRSRLQNIAID
jgi:hypothetical protein